MGLTTLFSSLHIDYDDSRVLFLVWWFPVHFDMTAVQKNIYIKIEMRLKRDARKPANVKSPLETFT